MVLNVLNVTLFLCLLIGLAIVIRGLLYKLYPKPKGISHMNPLYDINKLALSKPLKPVLDFFVGDSTGYFYKRAKKLLTYAESTLSVQGLYLIKFISLILAAIVVLLIRYTNIDLSRQAIMAKPSYGVNIFTGNETKDYEKNIELYETILRKIGKQNIKKLDDNIIMEKVRKILPEVLNTSDHITINEKSNIFLTTYRKVQSITLFNWWTILAIIFSFWIPEGLLIIKHLLLINMYRKEVIKLENIFELLGSVQGIKTLDILNEMARASSIYKKHLLYCIEHFKTDKERALEALKASVHSTRFSKLVDVMRVFSLTDRKLAMQILERNRLEQEENLLITAEEDVDMADLIAFISIVPVVWLLINLLLKPMLDTIFEVFKYV